MPQDTASYGPAPRLSPESYPGRRPGTSYVFRGETIDAVPSARLLGMLGPDAHAPPGRYAILGHGSNANPAQLLAKFGAAGRPIPVIRGTMAGLDVVYASAFASYGSVPATVARSPGTAVEMWITLLDARQLGVMDRTEGRGDRYALTRLDGFVSECGERLRPAYAYVSKAGPLHMDGGPVRLAEVPATDARFPAMTQREVLRAIRRRLAPSHSHSEFMASLLDRPGRYDGAMSRWAGDSGGFEECRQEPETCAVV